MRYTNAVYKTADSSDFVEHHEQMVDKLALAEASPTDEHPEQLAELWWNIPNRWMILLV